MIKKVLAIIDAIPLYSGRLFAFLSILVIMIIMAEVIARYIFNSPFIWSHESMTFASAFLYTLGGGYVLCERGHVSVDIIHKHLSVKGKAILNIIASLFMFFYIIILTQTTLNYALRSISILGRSGTPWNPPVYPVKTAIFIAVILILLAAIGNLIRDIYTAATGREDL